MGNGFMKKKPVSPIAVAKAGAAKASTAKPSGAKPSKGKAMAKGKGKGC